MSWLFPNGLGTRAVLAFAIVAGALYALRNDAAAMKELALIVVGFYFAVKAALDQPTNGRGGG